LIVTWIGEGTAGVKSLFSGLLRCKVERRYVLFIVLSPPILFAVSFITARLLQGAWPDLKLLGQVDYLPYLGVVPALGIWLLTWGLGEEIGWRGFALSRLQAIRSAFSASMLLGVLWGIWHIPAHFYRDTLSSSGLLLAIPMLFVSLLAASCIFTWLYNGTRGSLLMITIFHSWFNYLAISQAGGDFAPIIMSALMVIWAVRIVNGFGRENMAPADKVII
jgi:membrane protease YdiL (CAAX protease family)